MHKTGSAGRGRASPAPQPAVNYYIVQVFVAFSEQSQTPMILRVDENCSVQEVLEQALDKYQELLGAAAMGDASTSSFAPPSSSPDDYILRVARGDGLPDRGAAALVKSGVMKEQGLVFPYMVVLTLDPNRAVSDMQLTDQFKATLVRRNSQSRRPGSSLGSNPTTPLRSLPFDGTFDPYPKESPEDATLASLRQGPTPEQLQAEQAAVKTVEEKRMAREALEAKRLANLSTLEKEAEERERQHLEDCEKKERERRRALVEQRRDEEARQLQSMEEHHKMEMARKMEQYMKEQTQREMFEEQQKQLEKEERERQRRHEALERERQKRQLEKEEAKKQSEVERKTWRENEREKRMGETMDLIISKLNYDVEMDNRARIEALERERAEREAQERMLYEREYIARVEKQRKAQKEDRKSVV